VHPAAVVAGSVLANDTDPDAGPAPLTVSASDATSANGGTVTMLPNGSFNYLPATGFTGVDTFNYTVSDGIASATATVTISVSARVWYVNPAAAGPQSGRSPDPFASIGQAQAASLANDYIHVAQGAQATGILLKNGQLLIGSGVPLVVGPYTLAPATVRPTLGGTIVLASGNTVAGLNVAALASGITGSAVAGGTISEVGISGGSDGLVLTSTTGAFTLTNVTVAPGGIGVTINGGTPSITANNVNVTTTGSTGIVGTGSGSLAFNGGSVSTTNGAVVNLTNLTLGGSGLTAVNATNAVNGIVLSNTPGTFAVTGTGGAGSGGTISAMSGVGVSATNAGGVTLQSMNINNSGAQGVVVSSAVPTASSLNVQGSSFSGNFSTAVQTLNSAAGAMAVTVNSTTFTNNAASIAIQTTAGPIDVNITNNISTFNTGIAITVNRTAASGQAGEATITGNTIGASGVPNSGAVCGGGCGGIQVIALGANTFNTLIDNNIVRQFDAVGIRVRGSNGSGAMNATITNNTIDEPVAGALNGINVQSGAVAADTNATCAGITGNTVTGAFSAQIRVVNNPTSAGTTFSLPGYAGSGTDLIAVANYLIATNNITTATAARKTTVPPNQFSGGAACALPTP
jgi:hypothetical protein